jgi:hypothetical protein
VYLTQSAVAERSAFPLVFRYAKFRRHHSFTAKSDQARDHEVFPPKNALQTWLIPSFLKYGTRAAAGSAKLASILARSGPRNQSSHGRVNVRLR